MSRTIELSDEIFEALRETAARRGATPEGLIESLILAEQRREPGVYDDLDTFFRSFGASDEEIRESERLFREREQVARETANDADL